MWHGLQHELTQHRKGTEAQSVCAHRQTSGRMRQVFPDLPWASPEYTFSSVCADSERLCQPRSGHTGPFLLEPVTREGPLLFWLNLVLTSVFLRWSVRLWDAKGKMTSKCGRVRSTKFVGFSAGPGSSALGPGLPENALPPAERRAAPGIVLVGTPDAPVVQALGSVRSPPQAGYTHLV